MVRTLFVVSSVWCFKIACVLKDAMLLEVMSNIYICKGFVLHDPSVSILATLPIIV
jgi:hypothetical protein